MFRAGSYNLLPAHDAVTLASHVALQPSFDDGECELEERSVNGAAV
jgi:hypothetical protein